MMHKNSDQPSAETAVKKHRWYFYVLTVLAAIIFLFVGFLLFLTITEFRPKPVEDAITGNNTSCPKFDGSQFRIVTFNSGYGGLGREEDFLMDGGKGTGAGDRETVEKNMAGIKDILEKTNADIYMIQEIDRKSHRTFNINQLDDYAQILPEHPWYYAQNYVCKFVPYPLQAPMMSIDSGIATYSRYQVDTAQRISLPLSFSWPVRTANLKRCMLTTRMPVEGSDKELVIINFHLEAYDDGAGKAAQTQQLLQMLKDEYAKGNYIIAGGDFNQIFPDVHTVVKPTSEWVPGNLDPLPDGWNGWRYVYDDTVPTCRLLNQPYVPEDPLTQYYVIDGFIVSPNLDVVRIQTLDEGFIYSDHNPVVMDVVPRGEK